MSDTEAKQHDASARKLKQKRKEGAVSNIQEAVGYLSMFAGLLALFAFLAVGASRVEGFFTISLSLMEMPFHEASRTALSYLVWATFSAVIPTVLAAISMAVIAALVLNGGIVFSMKPVTPDFQRVSISAGIKRVFGLRTWVDLGMGIIRLFVWILCVIVVAGSSVFVLFKNPSCSILCQTEKVYFELAILAIVLLVLLLIFTLLEVLVQQKMYLKDQAMTETELKQERKDQGPSKEVRRERKRVRKLLESMPDKPIPESATTLLFQFEDDLVGINFDPPEQKLPIICAKARNRTKSAELLERLPNVPIIQSEAIFKNCKIKGMGEHLDSEFFKEFATAYVSNR